MSLDLVISPRQIKRLLIISGTGIIINAIIRLSWFIARLEFSRVITGISFPISMLIRVVPVNKARIQ